MDYGLNAGIKIGPLGIRYILGLANITGSDDLNNFIGHASNRTIQIYLQASNAFGKKK